MNPRSQPLIVWWVLWLALLSGVFITYFILGGSPRPGGQPAARGDSLLWLVALGPFFASIFIRWGLLARTARAQRALVLFVLGMALAESVCFMGLFLAPAHQLELFILSVLGMAQYVPYFAGRFTG
jgi:hypothetical protein